LEELNYKVDLSNWFLITNEDLEQVNGWTKASTTLLRV